MKSFKSFFNLFILFIFIVRCGGKEPAYIEDKTSPIIVFNNLIDTAYNLNDTLRTSVTITDDTAIDSIFIYTTGKQVAKDTLFIGPQTEKSKTYQVAIRLLQTTDSLAIYASANDASNNFTTKHLTTKVK